MKGNMKCNILTLLPPSQGGIGAQDMPSRGAWHTPNMISKMFEVGAHGNTPNMNSK